jgi:hypothetical protein
MCFVINSRLILLISVWRMMWRVVGEILETKIPLKMLCPSHELYFVIAAFLSTSKVHVRHTHVNNLSSVSQVTSLHFLSIMNY